MSLFEKFRVKNSFLYLPFKQLNFFFCFSVIFF